MIFLLIILAALLLCAAVLYLPYAAGLTKVEKKKRKKSQTPHKSTVKADISGYVPPDEEYREQDEAKSSSLGTKMKISSEDMPIRIRLSENGVLRKRGERSVGDTNPNNYDYDLDDLIREETEGELQRKTQEFYKNEHLGGEKEDMV